MKQCQFTDFEQNLNQLFPIDATFRKATDHPVRTFFSNIKMGIDTAVYYVSTTVLDNINAPKSLETKKNAYTWLREHTDHLYLINRAAIFGPRGLALASSLAGGFTGDCITDLLRAEKMAQSSYLTQLKEPLESIFASAVQSFRTLSEACEWINSLSIGTWKAITLKPEEHHAIQLLVKRNGCNDFEIRLFNTGDGIQYHLNYDISPNNELYQLSYIVKNISYKNLQTFFQTALLNKVSLKTLYREILPQLGTVVTEKTVKSLDRCQPGGKCVASSIYALSKQLFQLYNQNQYKQGYRECRIAIRLYFLQELIAQAQSHVVKEATALVLYELSSHLLKPVNKALLSTPLQKTINRIKKASQEILNSTTAPTNAPPIEKLIYALRHANLSLFQETKKKIIKELKSLSTFEERMTALEPLFKLDPTTLLGISSREVLLQLAELPRIVFGNARKKEINAYPMEEFEYGFINFLKEHLFTTKLHKENPDLADWYDDITI